MISPKVFLRGSAFPIAMLALASCNHERMPGVGQPAASLPPGEAVPASTASPSPAKTVAASPVREAEFAQIIRPFLTQNCVDCHNADIRKADLNLEELAAVHSLEKGRETWEKVFGKLRHGEMPPKDEPRPDAAHARAFSGWLAAEFKRQDDAAPVHVGRVAPRRLNRSEYNNTVRDLLGVNFLPADDFPPDDSGYGFDNNGDVLSLSPMLTEKYLKAAEKVARTAVFGVEPLKPTSYTHQPWYIDFDTTKAVKQVYDETGLSLPYALHVTHRFPVDADYDLTGFVRGFKPIGAEPCRVGFWIDGELVQEVQVPIGPGGEMNGLHQKIRQRISAGEHWLSVSLIKIYEGLPAAYGAPNPNQSTQRIGKSPTEHFINNLIVTGPFNQARGPTPASMEKLYRGAVPAGKVPPARAREIVSDLARRAYRRPVTAAEADQLMGLVAIAEKDGESFEEGLSLALTRLLISPHFLFRLERDPPANAKAPWPLAQHELATRLSYFLWSSMPDDELLRLADEGKLEKPGTVEAQVRRMIQDPKAFALVENFGGQWLQFRALESHTVERKAFQHFTNYTRMSMQRETEKFFEHLMREDRSVLDFIEANYSFLNQRLAEYYGIPGVEGTGFRKVTLPPESQRQGVLTHASVLTVSSYANRTSPVLRGKFILENILNSPPPPPPGDVPGLGEEAIGVTRTMRQQLEAHRSNPVCASCHVRMDPLGFGLENFDAVGKWRDTSGKFPIDATGALPDGRTFAGPLELAAILKVDKEDFVECITDKLLTYALGRGLTVADRSAVRRIAAQLPAADYRFSSLVLGIVNTPQFRLRAPAPAVPKT
jgi:mono/diheme cytochrome c family protein